MVFMNKVFFFAVALLICSACGSRPEGYVIRGNFPGLQDGMVISLRSMENQNVLATDTVKDKKFELRGTIASPHYCNLLISRNDTSGKVTMFNTYMFLDNSELTMKVAHLDSMQFVHPFLAKSAATKARVEGGALQREYYEYYESLFPLLNAANQADANVSSLNFIGNYTPEEYDRKFDELYPKKQAAMEAADEAKMQFIRQHPHSPLSLFIISELLNNPFERTREEVKELTEIASHIEDTVRLPQVLKMAETARTLYKGAKYKDLELTDPKGQTVKLSQYVHPDRYTLVDFWASWCGPCRWAIPKVESLYKRYDRQQLGVISISFDQKKPDWEKAMKEEKMPWTQLWAGSRAQVSAAQEAYKINGIPRLLLIAPDGSIAFSGPNPDILRLTIEKYLGK